MTSSEKLVLQKTERHSGQCVSRCPFQTEAAPHVPLERQIISQLKQHASFMLISTCTQKAHQNFSKQLMRLLKSNFQKKKPSNFLQFTILQVRLNVQIHFWKITLLIFFLYSISYDIIPVQSSLYLRPNFNHCRYVCIAYCVSKTYQIVKMMPPVVQ